MLYHTAAFEQSRLRCVALEHVGVHSVGLHAAEVGQQFLQASCSRKHIYSPVVVEKERRVVEVRNARVQRPALTRVFCRINVATERLVVGREVKIVEAVVVAQRRCPLPTSIHGALLHVVFWSVVERREHIAHCFPVYKVFRVHHRRTWHKVHGGRNEPVVVAHANHIGVRHVGPHHWIAHSVLYLHHLLGKASAHHAVALSRVVQRVAGAGAALRPHYVSRRYHLWQSVYDGVVRGAVSAHFLAHHLAGHQGHVGGFEVEVCQEVFIHGLHLQWPVLLSRVGLALQHQYAFYHAFLLCLSGQFHKSCVRVAVIVLGHVFHPVGLFFQIACIVHFVKQLDSASADGHVYHSHPHVVGQTGQHGASEVVGRCKPRVRPAQWRHSLVPLSAFPP